MTDNIRRDKNQDLNTEETQNTDLPDQAGCSCHDKHKIRTAQEMKSLIHRLNRVEGQIRGIKRMVEENAYCIDILNQVSAANAALNSFVKLILSDHIRSCVAEDVREGNSEKLDELIKIFPKLMK